MKAPTVGLLPFSARRVTVGERGRVARGHCSASGCIVLRRSAVDGGSCTASASAILGPGESRRSRQILVYAQFLFGMPLLPHGSGSAVGRSVVCCVGRALSACHPGPVSGLQAS